jgi:hypothetical protein
MPSRKKQVEETMKKLEDAFQRLKDGAPIHIHGEYKINPSKVEDEAAVARSTLYGPKYKGLIEEIKDYKATTAAKEQGFSDASDALKAKLKSTREELAKSEKNRKDLAVELKRVEKILLERTGRNLDVVALLIQEIPADKRAQIDALISQANIAIQGDNGNKVVKISTRSRKGEV